MTAHRMATAAELAELVRVQNRIRTAPRSSGSVRQWRLIALIAEVQMRYPQRDWPWIAQLGRDPLLNMLLGADEASS